MHRLDFSLVVDEQADPPRVELTLQDGDVVTRGVDPAQLAKLLDAAGEPLGVDLAARLGPTLVEALRVLRERMAAADAAQQARKDAEAAWSTVVPDPGGQGA